MQGERQSGRGDGSGVRARAGREVRRLVAQLRKTLQRARLGQRWDTGEADGFTRRVYPDYASYVAHQRTKLDAFRESSIQRHDRRFHAALHERLGRLPWPLHGRRVLCLAARQGTEVRAFIGHGAFAVGIDLNPGRDNRYVVVGDFHDLQFASGSVDLVYTNSLDHAFDLDRILGEVRRVLAPGGFLVAEVGQGTEQQGAPGFYEALSWSGVDEILGRIERQGFRLAARTPFQVPWTGDQLVLQRAP